MCPSFSRNVPSIDAWTELSRLSFECQLGLHCSKKALETGMTIMSQYSKLNLDKSSIECQNSLWYTSINYDSHVNHEMMLLHKLSVRNLPRYDDLVQKGAQSSLSLSATLQAPCTN